MEEHVIGVYVEKPEIFYSLVEKLKEKRIPFTLKFNNGKSNVVLVITDSPWKIKSRTRILVIRNSGEAEYVAERAALVYRGIQIFNSLLIGIDPGENIGFAVIGDGIFIKGKTFREIKRLIKEIENTINNLPFIRCKIKVGSRSQYSEKILAEILKIKKANAIVEVVDEKAVSRTIPKFILNKNNKIPKDVISAVNIAFARGIEVTTNDAENNYT